MSEDEKNENDAWEFFVALMFIGIGIGMLFDAAGAGALIGMGLGFIVSSLVKRVERKYVVVIPRSIASLVIILIGLGFIVGGLHLLNLIVIPEKAYQYIGAFLLIFIGIAIIITGFKIKSKKRE